MKKLEKMLHVCSKMLHSVGFETFFAFWSILEAFWSISGNRKNAPKCYINAQNATFEFFLMVSIAFALDWSIYVAFWSILEHLCSIL